MSRARHLRAFERQVAAALRQIPEAFRPYLENVAVVVEEAASEAVLASLDVDPDEGLYGLFEGPSLLEQDPALPELPPRIILYRWPLVEDFPDPEEQRTEILRTVLHEVAHHFGIEEDRLEALGWD